MTSTTVTIKADDENNAVVFWAALKESFPEIAEQLREGTATVDTSTWDLIKSLDGFSDGPEYAKQALIVVA